MTEKIQGSTSKRKHYIDYSQVSSAKRHKREKLMHDMKGILISCNNGNGGKATREAYDLCNEFSNCETTLDEVDSNDLSGELERELKDLKSSQSLRPFKSIDSGAKNIIFIRFENIESSPRLLVERIFDDFLESKITRTRFIEKFIPISLICRADIFDIKKAIPRLLKEESQLLTDNSNKYSIYYRCRNNNEICRMSVIEMVNLAILEEKFKLLPTRSNPTIGIIIEVIASKCCLGLVRHYERYTKYNINEMCQKFSRDAEKFPKPVQTPQVELLGRSDETSAKLNLIPCISSETVS